MRFGIAWRLRQKEFPQENSQRSYFDKELNFHGALIDQNTSSINRLLANILLNFDYKNISFRSKRDSFLEVIPSKPPEMKLKTFMSSFRIVSMV